MNRFFNNFQLLIALILIVIQLNVSGSFANSHQLKQGFLQADFTTIYANRTGCCPFYVEFKDSSFSTSGNIVTWEWNFGDGYSSLEKNPNHVFQKPGIYNVTLKITTDSGYTDQLTKTGYINCAVVPSSNFIPTPSYANLSQRIYFRNRTDNQTPLTTYYWCFGDFKADPDSGGISHEKNPSWNFSETGHYNILLVVSNEYNCRDSSYREVVIIPDSENDVWFPTLHFHDKWFDSGWGGRESYPFRVSGVTELHIEIFTLTGQLVFKSEAPESTAWEATFLPNNSAAPSGMYIVRVKYLGYDKVWYSKTKKIVLER
jgi:PKD repeat protein